mmetsp:Transcript_6002/g.18353  ORF Transcript_6002/g.18353 Transcript_6002/m.18353 type:complete len:212 (+) Transcript_6002:417-1052(+)
MQQRRGSAGRHRILSDRRVRRVLSAVLHRVQSAVERESPRNHVPAVPGPGARPHRSHFRPAGQEHTPLSRLRSVPGAHRGLQSHDLHVRSPVLLRVLAKLPLSQQLPVWCARAGSSRPGAGAEGAGVYGSKGCAYQVRLLPGGQPGREWHHPGRKGGRRCRGTTALACARPSSFRGHRLSVCGRLRAGLRAFRRALVRPTTLFILVRCVDK